MSTGSGSSSSCNARPDGQTVDKPQVQRSEFVHVLQVFGPPLEVTAGPSWGGGLAFRIIQVLLHDRLDQRASRM